MNRRIALLLLACGAATAACADEQKASAAQPGGMKEGDVPPRPAVVGPPSVAYAAIQVDAAGGITGTVEFDGVIPPDTTIELGDDARGCGPNMTIRRVENDGSRIAGAAVWLTDIRRGRQLPIERRFELKNDDCALDPKIQVVLTGGTLNLGTNDAAIHRDRIIDVATGESRGIAPFNDNGQVVPFDRLLTRPAQLEIFCELHPWSRAWVLVLDHPYYAVTDRSGSFSLEGIPAGTYRLRAWHPTLGVVDRQVVVAAGEATTVGVKLPSAAPAPPPTDSAPAGDGDTTASRS